MGKKKLSTFFIPYSGPQTLLAVICNVFDPLGSQHIQNFTATRLLQLNMSYCIRSYTIKIP